MFIINDYMNIYLFLSYKTLKALKILWFTVT